MFTQFVGARLNRVVFAAAVFCLGVGLQAAETVHYGPVPNSSKLRMDGDSTVHKWHAETDIIGGSMELEATFPDSSANATPSAVKPKVEVKVPVRSLKTSGGKKMDAVMQEHMKAAQFPRIEYRVLELSPKSPAGAGTSAQFDAKGVLTIAGVTKTNTMAVNIERLDKTKLKVVGSTGLKMTDFGITPPAPDIGLGLIKTSDDVTIKFEWVTEPKAAAP